VCDDRARVDGWCVCRIENKTAWREENKAPGILEKKTRKATGAVSRRESRAPAWSKENSKRKNRGKKEQVGVKKGWEGQVIFAILWW